MLEKVPLFAVLATGSSIITFISQQSGGKAINVNNLSLPTRLGRITILEKHCLLLNEKAISHYKMAIKHKPDYAKANIGIILLL